MLADFCSFSEVYSTARWRTAGLPVNADSTRVWVRQGPASTGTPVGRGPRWVGDQTRRTRRYI